MDWTKSKIEDAYGNGFLSKEEYLNMLAAIKPDGSINTQTIGVFDGSMLLTRLDLKQLSLYFDHFQIIDLNTWLSTTAFDKVDRSYLSNRSELDWLLEKELIAEIKFPDENTLSTRHQETPEFEKIKKLYAGEFYNQQIKAGDKSSETYQRDMADFLHKLSIHKARLQCTELNKKFAKEAYPIIDNLNDLSEFTEGLPKAHVVNVLLKKVPMPDSNTPWEDIFNFRNDPDSKEKFKRLRRWLNKFATQELGTSEIYEEVEYLMHDYQKHMQLHHMKTNQGFIKTTVLTSMSILENLIKLKWSESAQKMLDFKGRHIALMEAEMKAPGRELAYLVKANDKFRING